MKSVDELISQERKLECVCGLCGLHMELIEVRKKRNRYDKGHKMYICYCGNKFRARSVNEILRDLQIKE